jgi:hypothetical protein
MATFNAHEITITRERSAIEEKAPLQRSYRGERWPSEVEARPGESPAKILRFELPYPRLLITLQ